MCLGGRGALCHKLVDKKMHTSIFGNMTFLDSQFLINLANPSTVAECCAHRIYLTLG